MSALESLMKDVARAQAAELERRRRTDELRLPIVSGTLGGFPNPPATGSDGPSPSSPNAIVDPARVRSRAARTRAIWVGGFATAAACAAALAIGIGRRAPAPLAFAIDGGSGAGRTGEAIEAPAGAAVRARFTDGSEIAVAPRARAHVAALGRDGATVAIDAGEIDVAVVHRARTRWQIDAGPYHIAVTGTRFRAGWEAAREALTVEMREGSVIVTGPRLGGAVRLRGGERLHVDPTGVAPAKTTAAAAEPTSGAAATAEADAPVPAASAVAEPPPTRERAPMAHRRTALASGPAPAAARAPEAPSWRALAARAHYREALDAAVAGGFREACRDAGADNLLLLGDVARLAGDPTRAEEAYRLARRRFPSADRPLFALGVIAFEARHAYREAGDLFAAYVDRFPRGPLAREAAGRLVEARIAAHDRAAARAAATRYLAAYPDGPHAQLARGALAP